MKMASEVSKTVADASRSQVQGNVDEPDLGAWVRTIESTEHIFSHLRKWLVSLDPKGGGSSFAHTRYAQDVQVYLKYGETEKAETPEEFLFTGMQPATESRTTESATLRREKDDLLVERERLKSQLISVRRELLELRQHEAQTARELDRLRHQNDGQLDCVHDLTRANAALQQALIQRIEGRLCMHEHNEGVVLEITDAEVAVQFKTRDGELEQVFHKSQFIGGHLPDEGDRLEAHVFTWRRSHKPRGIERFLTKEEMEDVERAFKKGVTGPVEA
jgi:hypothetical protein